MPNTSILNNIPAQFVADNIRNISEKIQTSTTRLASGKQITKASDNAAGASIGLGLEIDKSTSKAALTTATQANSILAISDGGMQNLVDIAARLKSLAAQGNSGALGATELGYIQNEMNALVEQIGTVVNTTKFGETTLLDGSYSGKNFQVGTSQTDTISINFSALDANTLGIANLDVVNNVGGANDALDTAIDTIKTARAQLGALESRFNSAIENLESTINNLTAAASEYLDADFTEVATELANQQTQFQAGISVLAQVNQLTANLLKLLG